MINSSSPRVSGARSACSRHLARVGAVPIALVIFAHPAVAQVPTEAGRVGLVVSAGDDSVFEGCLDLPPEGLTGEELLYQSGLDVALQASVLGTMVCRIGDTGCDHPREPCWCSCRSLGADCTYWAYHTLEDGAWRYSPFGPASRRLEHGDVDGWAWGPGSVIRGAAPPTVTFEQLCGSADDGAAIVETGASPPTTSTQFPPTRGTGGNHDRNDAVATPAGPKRTPLPPSASSATSTASGNPAGDAAVRSAGSPGTPGGTDPGGAGAEPGAGTSASRTEQHEAGGSAGSQPLGGRVGGPRASSDGKGENSARASAGDTDLDRLDRRLLPAGGGQSVEGAATDGTSVPSGSEGGLLPARASLAALAVASLLLLGISVVVLVVRRATGEHP